MSACLSLSLFLFLSLFLSLSLPSTPPLSLPLSIPLYLSLSHVVSVCACACTSVTVFVSMYQKHVCERGYTRKSTLTTNFNYLHSQTTSTVTETIKTQPENDVQEFQFHQHFPNNFFVLIVSTFLNFAFQNLNHIIAEERLSSYKRCL